MELCVSRVELFHVEQLDPDTQDRLSERSPAARSHLVALTESRQCSTWNISFVRSRHSKAPRHAIANASHLTCNTRHKILKELHFRMILYRLMVYKSHSAKRSKAYALLSASRFLSPEWRVK